MSKNNQICPCCGQQRTGVNNMPNKRNVMDFSLRSDADIVITNTCGACVNEITQKG